MKPVCSALITVQRKCFCVLRNQLNLLHTYVAVMTMVIQLFIYQYTLSVPTTASYICSLDPLKAGDLDDNFYAFVRNSLLLLMKKHCFKIASELLENHEEMIHQYYVYSGMFNMFKSPATPEYVTRCERVKYMFRR